MTASVFQAAVADAQGNVLANAQITVRDEETGSLASLWQDRDQTTGLTNPFNADADGFFRFYVAPGRYQIDAVKDADSRTWRDVELPLFDQGFLNGWAGHVRPNNLQAGARWMDISGDSASPPTPWILKVYDGADDIPIYEIDKATNQVKPYVGDKPLSALLPPAYIAGLTIEDLSTTQITVKSGFYASADGSQQFTLASDFVKTLAGPFVEGSGNNGLDAGSIAADTVYHVFLISKDNGQTDILFSTSKTAPTLPSGFTSFARIGTKETDSVPGIRLNSVVQVVRNGEVTRTLQSTTAGQIVRLCALLQSDVIRAELNWQGVSASAASQPPILRIGPSTGVLTSTYVWNGGAIAAASAAETLYTDGIYTFRTLNYNVNNPVYGQLRLRQVTGGNVWHGVAEHADGASLAPGAGHVDLVSPLAIAEITTPGGTSTFDGGQAELIAWNYD